MDNFVFLSHANDDKPRLLDLVRALIDAGIKIWLDKPSKLGFSLEDIDKYFYHIRAGGRWEDEMDEAKRKSSCILVCWSKRAEGQNALMLHQVLFEEAAFGRTEEKLVSCSIDDVDVTRIPRDFSLQQILDARNATELGLIIAAVKRVMNQSARRWADQRQIANKRRSPMIPYLADRSRQEGAVEDGLNASIRVGGVRPFFVAGPENECVDEFLKRLEEHTSRRCLDGSASWEAVEARWPDDEPAENFADVFMRRVGNGFDRRFRLTAHEFAALFSERGRPVAVISRLRTQDWDADEAKRVRAWLELWREIASEHGFRTVVPILAVKMPPAKPGWTGVPGGGWLDMAGRRNRLIWEELGRLAREYAALGIVPLEILAPVPKQDVNSWCSNYFSLEDVDRAAALDAVRKLFGIRNFNLHGVPHADFATAMLPLFRGAN